MEITYGVIHKSIHQAQHRKAIPGIDMHFAFNVVPKFPQTHPFPVRLESPSLSNEIILIRLQTWDLDPQTPYDPSNLSSLLKPLLSLLLHSRQKNTVLKNILKNSEIAIYADVENG
jgi:hypothetical protein